MWLYNSPMTWSFLACAIAVDACVVALAAPFRSPAHAFERFFDTEWPAPSRHDHGNGRFGRWIVDADGLPAYEYQVDQTKDPKAAYVTTTGESRDHWHLIGNDRITATAHNGGYVQLYDWTRGGKAVNRWDPNGLDYAGGFKFVATGGQTFCTLWRQRPEDARQRRVFGMGYVERTTTYDSLAITERIAAPAGDVPALVSTTVIRNRSNKPVRLSVVEFWDANLYQLTPAMMMSARQQAFVERLPYYPPSAGRSGTVLEHAKVALDHLCKAVGTGSHGLLRCGSGDWNDELIRLSKQPKRTMKEGESALNAGLATVALPALADAVESVDEKFASRLRKLAGKQAKALASLWTGKWVARGYIGVGDQTLGEKRLFLDAQAFGVLGGVWDPAKREEMFGHVRSLCAEPQKVGALSLVPPVEGRTLEPGSDTNGGTWAAIDSWLAWAWATHDPERAWEFYLSTTLAAHAEAYPHIWYGIWSGPDSFNAHDHPRPGETFNAGFTPMTDFPVMNMNRHAGPLLDAIKLAGVRPHAGRIVIDPLVPFESFALRLPLIGAAYLPDRHRGYYAPVVDGRFEFAVRLPKRLKEDRVVLVLDGRPAKPARVDKGMLRFEAHGTAGDRTTWEIRRSR